MEFFRIVCSFFFENPVEERLQEKLDRAASETNDKVMITKTFFVDKTKVVFSIEKIVKNHEEFKYNINNTINYIQCARDAFMEKMENVLI